jgi:chitin disaccharide deacetylase
LVAKGDVVLIINADDYGRNVAATDNTLLAFRYGSITSASAMVFMDDSERAAQLALEAGLEVGLHLNLSEVFSKPVSSSVIQSQEMVSSFLLRSRWHKLIYNPFLSRHFDLAFKAQYEEFARIYGKAPSHIDGHHHLHLCANMVFGNIIPAGMPTRRNYTFYKGDKGRINRFYRRCMDAWLRRGHIRTSYFFALPCIDQQDRLRAILALAGNSSVELMAHPEKDDDFVQLMSDEFSRSIRSVRTGTHACLPVV